MQDSGLLNWQGGGSGPAAYSAGEEALPAWPSTVLGSGAHGLVFLALPSLGPSVDRGEHGDWKHSIVRIEIKTINRTCGRFQFSCNRLEIFPV